MAEFSIMWKFQGEPVLVRLDTLMQHHWWDRGQFPDSIVNIDNFSVRWTGKDMQESGRYFLMRTTVRSSKEDIGYENIC